MQIDLDGAEILMAQPERNSCEVHPGLQQVHGAGVPKRVGTDPFAS
jgi:hypothetical protein